jgi:hypothetical protein
MKYSQAIISSPLGDLVAVASPTHLVMLEFADSENLERKIQNTLPLVGGARVGTLEIPHPTSPTRGGVENPILTKTILQLEEYFS